MKKMILLAGILQLCLISMSQRTSRYFYTVIPEPVKKVTDPAARKYILPVDMKIAYTKNEELRNIAGLLAIQLKTITGYKVSAVQSLTGTVTLQLNNDTSIKEEGYRLTVNQKGISIIARKPAGIFYGVQTLIQLIPPGSAGNTENKKDKWDLPQLTIEDYPRFAWRGLMLDVARHFFTVAQVKDYIDQMVKYKFNLLHLHLTDDQGLSLIHI